MRYRGAGARGHGTRVRASLANDQPAVALGWDGFRKSVVVLLYLLEIVGRSARRADAVPGILLGLPSERGGGARVPQSQRLRDFTLNRGLTRPHDRFRAPQTHHPLKLVPDHVALRLALRRRKRKGSVL